MNIFKVLILFTIGVFLSENLYGQKKDQIDYSELNLMDYKLVLEIEESDIYFPGILGQLILTSSGDLIVSDRQKTTVERFSKNGRYRGVVARKGPGPGEIGSNSFHLAAGPDNSFIIHYGDTPRIDLFGLESDGSYQYKESFISQQFDGYHLEILEWHSEKTFFALKKKWENEIGLNLLEYRSEETVIFDLSTGLVEDSLHLLKTPNYLFGDPGRFSSPLQMDGLVFLGHPPYRFQDRLRIRRNGQYVIGRPGEDKVEFFDNNHRLVREVYLNVKERPVTEVGVDYFLDNNRVAVNRDVREELKKYIADQKPPFLDFWISDDSILMHVDTDIDGKKLVLLSLYGEGIGRIKISEYDSIQKFEEKRIYVLHQNPDATHSIRVYQLIL